MKLVKKISILIIVILLIIGGIKLGTTFYNKGKEEANIILRKERLKNDTLVKLNEGLYTKLVADSLTKKELNHLNDSLKLKLKNPKTITKIVFVPKEIEKDIDNVVQTDSTITINDYYPHKENKFVEYSANIDKVTGKGKGKFSWTPIEFSLGVTENEDGTYSLNTKVPEFMTVTGVHVYSRPIEPTKIDNFGWLIGGGIGTSFKDGNSYYKLSGGVRIKKFYVDIDLGTNGTSELGIKIEF